MTVWLIEALVGSSLLMLFVALVRRPMARMFGARIAYALWLLPVLRMMLPALPGWQPLYVPVAGETPAGGAAFALMDPASAAAMPPILPPVLTTTAPPPTAGLIADPVQVLLLLWLAGAIVWFGWQMARYVLFLRRAMTDSELLSRQAGIDIVISPNVDGPMAAGIVSRRIFLPADFRTRYTPEERRLALLHEGAHHDRRDIWANFAGLLFVALHWWNPIAHIAWRAFRADQELACDASVLSGAAANARAAYGSAVLKSACARTPTAACAMNHKSQLKERILMMKYRNFGRARLAAGAATIASAIVLGLIATASGAQVQPAPVVPPVPAAPQAPAAPAAPHPAAAPAVPAAPKPPHIEIIRVEAGKDVKPGEKRIIRTMVIKDGQVVTDDVGGPDAPDAMVGGDGKHRTVMIRRFADGKDAAEADKAMTEAHGAMGQAHRAMDQAHKDMIRAEHVRLNMPSREAMMAKVRADMAERCNAAGTPMDKNAELSRLATCGVDYREQVAKALATARTSIARDRNLSDAQRAEALKGIDQAVNSQMRNGDRIIIKTN